jgi:hypothetical protein
MNALEEKPVRKQLRLKRRYLSMRIFFSKRRCLLKKQLLPGRNPV